MLIIHPVYQPLFHMYQMKQIEDPTNFNTLSSLPVCYCILHHNSTVVYALFEINQDAII